MTEFVTNTAYRVTEDFMEYPLSMMHTLKRWIDEDLQNKLTPEEWSAMFEKEKVVIAKQGDIYFRSGYWKNNGLGLLFPANFDLLILKPKDLSFGLGLFYEKDMITLWEQWLKKNSETFEKFKFETFETKDLNFEQQYIGKELEIRREKYQGYADAHTIAINNIYGLVK